MNGIFNYFKQVLQDTNGSYSSKRLVTFICVILMGTGFVANLFWNYDVEQFMYESVMYIVIAGLGFAGAERFAPQKKTDE